MKRLLKIFGILIVLLVAAIVLLPIIFKDEIIERAKLEINNNLNAQVDFEDINISLFRSFPDFSLGIEKVTVDGKDKFDGIRLADIGEFGVDLNLYSVISGNQFEVEAISLKDAKVHVVIDTAGNANYDIVKETGEAEEEEQTTDESSGFKFTLKKYSIENFDLVYDDQQGDMLAVIKDLDHSGTGDFTEEIVNLKTKTSIEELTFKMEDVAYLSRVNTKADFDMSLNQTTFTFTFGENQVSLNDLVLKFAGTVAMPDEDIAMDMTFEAPKNDFKSVLSLIPAVYYADFKDMKTTGDFALKGMVKGTYAEEPETYPAFDISFLVDNATFRYPDLPAGVDAINVDAHIYNETADLDGMVIDVPKASAVVAGSPINAKLNLKTPMSDPQIVAFLKTDFQLSNIAKVVPASGYDYSGRIKADLDIAARMSDIDNERYDNVKANGQLNITNMVLKSDSLPYDVKIEETDLTFSPQFAALNTFKSQIGKSDISANGRIDNLLGYALQDKTLKANFSITSNLLDLNELSASDDTPAVEETADGTSAMEVIRLPENVDATLNATVSKIIYDNLEIEGLSGAVALQEGKAQLNNLTMNVLGGSLGLNGFYDSKPNLPDVDVEMDINNFSFKESFDKLVTIQKMVPIMETTTGTYGTKLSFKSKLNADMSPDLSSVQAKGNLVTRDMTTSPKSLEKLANILKNPDLKTLALNNVNISYEIKDGRLGVEPFDIKAANVSATVSGTSGLDQSLDYLMDMKIPTAGIKANDLLQKVGATSGGKLDLKVKIGGTFTNPKVTTSLSDLAGSVIDNLKNQAKEKVEEVKKEAIDKVNAEAQKLIDAAEKQGDALIAAAQKQADAIKAEAQKQAQTIRDEADKNAKKAISEAGSNPLKKAAAEKVAEGIRKEGNKAADKVVQEANTRADKLVNEARAQKEKLVQEARDKGKIQNP
jgi:cell division septum initiation protein DivIVA